MSNLDDHRPKKTPRIMWAVGVRSVVEGRTVFDPLDLFATAGEARRWRGRLSVVPVLFVGHRPARR